MIMSTAAAQFSFETRKNNTLILLVVLVDNILKCDIIIRREEEEEKSTSHMVTCLFNVHEKRLVWPTTAKEVAFDGNVVYDDDDYLIVDRILVLLLLLSQSYTRFSPPPLSSSSGQCSNKLLLFFYYSFGWIYIVNSMHASIFNGQFKIAPKCKPIPFQFMWQLHNHIISRLSLLTYQHILNLHKLPRKYFSNHDDVNVARCTKLLLSYS